MNETSANRTAHRSGRTVRRGIAVALLAAAGVGVAVAASSGSATADHPGSDRDDMEQIAEYARTHGLTGLSPASLHAAP